MARFKDYRLLAAVLGILVIAGPVLWFSAWLQRQGEADISAAARWTIGNIDVHVGRAVAVLDDLAERGVDSCGAAQLEILRRSLLTAGPVKELSVVGAQGQTLCTDRGDSIACSRCGVVRADREPEHPARRRAAGRRTMNGCCACAEWCPLRGCHWRRSSRPRSCCRRSRPMATGSPVTPASTLADDTVIGAVGPDMDAAVRDGLRRQPRSLRPSWHHGDGRHAHAPARSRPTTTCAASASS